jgi:hypothetical protein
VGQECVVLGLLLDGNVVLERHVRDGDIVKGPARIYG